MVQVRLGTSLDHRYNFVFGTAESTGTTSYVLDICTAGCKMLTHSSWRKQGVENMALSSSYPCKQLLAGQGRQGLSPVSSAAWQAR